MKRFITKKDMLIDKVGDIGNIKDILNSYKFKNLYFGEGDKSILIPIEEIGNTIITGEMGGNVSALQNSLIHQLILSNKEIIIYNHLDSEEIDNYKKIDGVSIVKIAERIEDKIKENKKEKIVIIDKIDMIEVSREKYKRELKIINNLMKRKNELNIKVIITHLGYIKNEVKEIIEECDNIFAISMDCIESINKLDFKVYNGKIELGYGILKRKGKEEIKYKSEIVYPYNAYTTLNKELLKIIK